MTPELPELPKPHQSRRDKEIARQQNERYRTANSPSEPPEFTAEQMLAYGRQCFAAGLARAERICRDYAAQKIKGSGEAAEFRSHGAEDCAEEIAAIRGT